MIETLAHSLSQINPFASPDKLPVIAYGNGRRVIRFMLNPPNSKGMINVQTLADLADGGTPITFTLAPSKVRVVGWFTIK